MCWEYSVLITVLLGNSIKYYSNHLILIPMIELFCRRIPDNMSWKPWHTKQTSPPNCTSPIKWWSVEPSSSVRQLQWFPKDHLSPKVPGWSIVGLRLQFILMKSDESRDKRIGWLPPANEVVGRLCFYRCLWFCPQGVYPSMHLGHSI